MKGSDLAALLRLIMYDIIGLVIPGFVLLLMGLGYAELTNCCKPLIDLIRFDNRVHIASLLIGAYVFAYFLQAAWYFLFSLFTPFGHWLLGKSIDSPQISDHNVSSSGKFTGRYFENSNFFKATRTKVAEAVGISNAESLTYSDVQNLAFSLAGDEADKARHFRFRSDLCGAIATLALIHLIIAIPLWSTTLDYIPCAWLLVPSGVLLWLISLALFKKDSLVVRVLCCVLPWLLAATAFVLRFTIVSPGWWWTIPAAILAWFFFLYRSYFYNDIGGRIVFYVAVAELVKSQKAVAKSAGGE